MSVAPNGDVNRCGTHDAASRELARGNILNGSGRPEARPQPCATSYCFYFGNKYAQKPSWPAQARRAPCPAAGGGMSRGNPLHGHREDWREAGITPTLVERGCGVR